MPEMKVPVLYDRPTPPLELLWAGQQEAIQTASRPWHWVDEDEVEVRLVSDQPLLHGYRRAIIAASGDYITHHLIGEPELDDGEGWGGPSEVSLVGAKGDSTHV